MLEMFGSDVTGYALASPTDEGAKLFRRSGVEGNMTPIMGDVRDFVALKQVFTVARPKIIFHLAAQPSMAGRWLYTTCDG